MKRLIMRNSGSPRISNCPIYVPMKYTKQSRSELKQPLANCQDCTWYDGRKGKYINCLYGPITVCSACKRVQDPDLPDVWVVTPGKSGAKIIRGICPECLEIRRQKLEEDER